MLRRTPRRLYLSPARAVLAEETRKAGLIVLKTADLTGRHAFTAIPELISDWSRPRKALAVHEIILDDQWCRFFMVTPPKNAGAARDITFSAANRFESLYDEAASDWVIEADCDAAKPFLSCAISRALLASLEQSTISNVAHVIPKVIHHCKRHSRKLRRGRGWLIVAGDAQAIVLVFSGGRPAAVHQLPTPVDLWSGHANLETFIDQECLRLNQAAPSDLVLCGTIPGHWKPSVSPTTRVHVEREDFAL